LVIIITSVLEYNFTNLFFGYLILNVIFLIDFGIFVIVPEKYQGNLISLIFKGNLFISILNTDTVANLIISTESGNESSEYKNEDPKVMYFKFEDKLLTG